MYYILVVVDGLYDEVNWLIGIGVVEWEERC